MITNQDIANEFKQFNRSSHNSLNIFALNQYVKSGVEIQTFGDRKGRGMQKVNPLKKMFNNGALTVQQYKAAKNYQHNFELSNISHHARPSYDGSGVGSIAFKSKDTFYSDSQLNASNYIATTRNIILQHNHFRNKNNKIVDRRYLEILELIFEKQKSVTKVEEAMKITKLVIERKAREICEIFLQIKK